MTITWLGYGCFRLETKEGSILVDPFSKDSGLKAPRIKDDIVILSRGADADLEAGPETFIVENPGEYESKGIHVRGISSYQDKVKGQERGLNMITVVKSEDIRICHLGYFGEGSLIPEYIEEIGDVDILMLPVGGNNVLDAKSAVEAISQIEPKIIIPMYYRVPGASEDFDTVEKFIKEIGLQPEKVDRFKVTTKTLPLEEVKLVVCEL